MAFVPVHQQNHRFGIILSSKLWYQHVFEPLEGYIFIRPAVVGANIVPIGYPPEFLDEPLGLEIFAFKDDFRFEGISGGGDSLNKGGSAAALVAFKIGLFGGCRT